MTIFIHYKLNCVRYLTKEKTNNLNWYKIRGSNSLTMVHLALGYFLTYIKGPDSVTSGRCYQFLAISQVVCLTVVVLWDVNIFTTHFCVLIIVSDVFSLVNLSRC